MTQTCMITLSSLPPPNLHALENLPPRSGCGTQLLSQLPPGLLAPQPGALSSCWPSTSWSLVHLHIVTKNTVAKSKFWASITSFLSSETRSQVNSLLTGLVSLHLSQIWLGKKQNPKTAQLFCFHYFPLS